MTVAERDDDWDLPDYDSYNAPWDAYYGALGRLVQMSGLLEVELHKKFKAIVFDLTNTEASEINWEILEALTGSLGSAEIQQNIQLVLRVVEYDDAFCKELQYAFEHIGHIRSFRNRIVHHGATSSSQTEFCVSNRETIKDGMQEELIFFDVETILSMAFDLNLATDYIGMLESAFLRYDHQQESWKTIVKAERPILRFNPALLRRDGPKHWPKPKPFKKDNDRSKG